MLHALSPSIDLQLLHDREYWTVGTRDFRNFMSIEMPSREDALRYREQAHLDHWVVVNVCVSGTGRAYFSPEQPDGPLPSPAAGNF